MGSGTLVRLPKSLRDHGERLFISGDDSPLTTRTTALGMPHKNFQLWLSEGCYLVVEFTTVDGLVASFVVRLMQVMPGRVANVARYDTAHGMAHLDLLDADENLVEKRWLRHMSFEHALTFAIRDFRRNYEKYLHP